LALFLLTSVELKQISQPNFLRKLIEYKKQSHGFSAEKNLVGIEFGNGVWSVSLRACF